MKVPESIAIAGRTRTGSAREQRNRALKAIYSGRPLDAEPSEARKVHRFQKVAGVSTELARKLSNYEPGALSGLAGERLLGAERIQGKSIDFVGVSFLDLARAAAHTVGRIVFRDLRPVGSGFMVSDRLLLTNNHVISSEEIARQSFVEFNYELDINGQPKSITRFALDPDEFFMTDPVKQLDFTLVSIGKCVNGIGKPSDFGYCPLINSDDKHVLGEFVNIIQYPEGDFKQVVLRENQLVNRLDRFLEYMADTNPGSSGSPVFNDQWEVIALHHWGEPTRLTSPDGKTVRKDLNEGIRISSIFKELQSRRSSTSNEKRLLLDKVLTSSLRHPSTIKENSQSAGTMNESQDDFRPRNSSAGQVEVKDGGIATWKIPLEVSVRIGSTIQPGKAHLMTEISVIPEKQLVTTPAEAVQIDPNYNNRIGYKPNFIPSHSIPLPKLKTTLTQSAARKLNVSHGEDPYELRYHHFSIVMNAKRRMAYFTAVNVDGSKSVSIDRDTGEPSEESEKAERWFEDPRIELSAQCDQSLYDHQKPKHIFDRGHLVRRQDPNWGTVNGAKKGNADTFHFTNCTPQFWLFNERAKYWAGLENYVLDNAKAEQERITVFTGPVFTDDDPDYRYVKVPKQFWKILVRVENDIILATALIADQSPLFGQLPEALESFDDKSKISQYQTSVKEIEKITGLNFGSLRDHDTFQPGLGESLGDRIELKSFEDIKLDTKTS
jgi:endonuclease G, mitochondrial